MARPSVDELLRVESRLNWSLGSAVVAMVVSFSWTLFVLKGGLQGLGVRVTALGLLILQLGCYVWFAISAGAAAKILGEARWKYVVWILVAPLFALVPIPIVSAIIQASPFSIKLLLGAQLVSAIRTRTFED